MAKGKNNNALYIGIGVAVVVVIAIIVAVVMMNKNKGNGGDTGKSDTGDSSYVEYNSVDESIALGDYEGMQNLSKSIQNGEMVGKIVKINGLVSHPMSTYSVVQANADGSQKIGTQFIIDGASDTDYPQDGDEIVITGEVVENGPMVFVIKTTKNNIEKR